MSPSDMITDSDECFRFWQSLNEAIHGRMFKPGYNWDDGFKLIEDISKFNEDFDNLSDQDVQNRCQDILEDFYDVMVVDSGQGKQTPDQLRRKYPVGFWNANNDNRYDGIGLNGIKYTQLLAATGTTAHVYSDIPEIVSWKLGHFDQGDIRCFIGSAEVCEIDAISSVPTMPIMSSAEMAKWVLSSSKGKNQWQRRLNSQRVHAIQKFASNSTDNHILNPILLYCDSNLKSVDLDWETGELNIDLGKFLLKKGIGYVDWKDHKKDLRPLWIVDGQHRTRGLAISNRGSSMRVPIIVLPGGCHPKSISPEAAAKIFTEINTFSEEIDFELKHFLANRFALPGLGSLDYSSLKVGQNATRKRRRANRYSYKLLAEITQSDGSFENGVAISPSEAQGSRSKIVRILLNKALQEVSKWFTNDEIYGPKSDMRNYAQITLEVNAFFEALDDIAGKNWNPSSGSKSLLEQKNVVRYLLWVYPRIRAKANSNRGLRKNSTPLSKDDFKEVLLPISNVDWSDRSMKTQTGEWASKWYCEWIARAVENGEEYSKAEIRSNDPALGILPGRGIRAPPGDPSLEIVGGQWPIVDGSIYAVKITPAANAHLGGKIEKLAIRVDGKLVNDFGEKMDKTDSTYVVTFKCDTPNKIEASGSFKNPNQETQFQVNITRPK